MDSTEDMLMAEEDYSTQMCEQARNNLLAEQYYQQLIDNIDNSVGEE